MRASKLTFRFHQTGTRLIKEGKHYRIHRKFQRNQAHKANVDYKIGKFFVPETVKFEWKEENYRG